MQLRDLVAIFGHELRTPLAAILGYQELLADGLYGELSDRQREPVDRIQYAAQQILSLIDGLQELAASSDPAEDERVDTDTRTVITQLQQRLRPMADARGVTLDGAG
ncbi:MAG: histidine kinase dimerization/phospho-acceptor domain-containing protein, partial [Longimicrobiales bacterium]